MQRTCSICGKEDWDKYMYSYFNGRRMMWLCWDCYKTGQRQNTQSEIYRNGKRQKEVNK